MSKMGYVPGQGLGRNGEGRAEPVPIQLLPSGELIMKLCETVLIQLLPSGEDHLIDQCDRLKIVSIHSLKYHLNDH